MILTEKLKTNKGENKKDFENKVNNISRLLGIDPDWLMMVMYLESSLDAQKVNKQPNDTPDPYTRSKFRATGLIQFMPDSARSHGTTTQELYKMNSIDQLDYVYRYFRNYAGKIKSFFDLYFITFFPLALGKPDTYILKTSKLPASLIAEQNPGYDLNKDRQITVGEIKSALLRRIPVIYLKNIIEKKSSS